MKNKSNKPDSKAIKEFTATIAAYRWKNKKEKDMMRMLASDRKDMREVRDLYKRGEWEKAKEKARSMDTLPREFIPEKIWNDITSI